VKIVFFAVFLGTVLVEPASGWGSDGHRVVGEIAWHHLTPRTRRALEPLLPAGEYGTLAEACTWADREARGRGRYRWLDPYHYVHLAGPAARLDSTSCPEGACVIEGIAFFRDRLGDREQSRDERRLALRMLGHLVGDVHQPLHVVAFTDGRGGSRTPVRYGRRTRVSLHELWDSVLLEDALRRLYRRGGDRPGGNPDVWRRFADDLDRTRAAALDEPLGEPMDWARESFTLASGPLFAIEEGEALPESYGREVLPVLEERLRAAGWRLARVLNDLFDPPGDPGGRVG
jgi:hypothetical protein